MPDILTDRLCLRIVRPDDATVWLEYLRRNDHRFLPWEPERAPEHGTLRYWRSAFTNHRRDASDGLGFRYHIWHGAPQRLVGVVALRQIERGFAQSAILGYSLDSMYEGRGFMVEAVEAVVKHGFERLQLHRIEATVMPDNVRSKKVLERTGFRLEGVMRENYLIAGRWADHELWARLSSDPVPIRSEAG